MQYNFVEMIEDTLKNSKSLLVVGDIYDNIAGERDYFLYYPAKMIWQLTEEEKSFTEDYIKDEIYKILSKTALLFLTEKEVKDKVELLQCEDFIGD